MLLTLPTQLSELNNTTPWGVIPISTLTVLWCLKFDHIIAQTCKFDGHSTKISKHYNDATFFPTAFWKQVGIIFLKESWSGHIIKPWSRMSI